MKVFCDFPANSAFDLIKRNMALFDDRVSVCVRARACVRACVYVYACMCMRAIVCLCGLTTIELDELNKRNDISVNINFSIQLDPVELYSNRQQ